MSIPFCNCRCKMCRVPGGRHCHAPHSCSAPAVARGLAGPGPRRSVQADQVVDALRSLRASSGSHSPSVAQIEQRLPGLVRIDACFLANPYATSAVMARLHRISAPNLERMVSHYPSQSATVAATLAPVLGVSPDLLHVGNGASELIQALLADALGTMVISLPTFSAYYEFARGGVITHQLDPSTEFRLDLDALHATVRRHCPETVVIINPNNPDGGAVPAASLERFLDRVRGYVRQVIVDESFLAFTTDDRPRSVADLVPQMPHLVVVNSLSKSHGIAGLRVGYVVAARERVSALRAASLWNLNTFGEWFCNLMSDAVFQTAYERARRRYVQDVRAMFAELAEIPGARAFPSAANFALLEVDRPAREVVGELLADHGVYVRDCDDKRGLDGDRFIRVAVRDCDENRRIVAALRDVLSRGSGAAQQQSGSPVALVDQVGVATESSRLNPNGAPVRIDFATSASG